MKRLGDTGMLQMVEMKMMLPYPPSSFSQLGYFSVNTKLSLLTQEMRCKVVLYNHYSNTVLQNNVKKAF